MVRNGLYWRILSIIGGIYTIDGSEVGIFRITIDADRIETTTTSWNPIIIKTGCRY